MRHTPSFTSIRFLAGAALLAGCAQAAELGEITPRSYIGQPLAADIELVALAPDEVGALQARLAQADVFRGANVTMNPALASVRMAVVRRDQKQFLHVTTTRPVEADYLHLYVELSAAGRQEVRLATVWLQADPNPPPPPAPAVPLATAMTSAQAGEIAAQARAERAAKAAATPAAKPAAPVRDRTRPAPLPSALESEVGVPGELKAAAAGGAVAGAAARRTPPESVRDLPERIAGVWVTPQGKPIKPSASQELAEGEVPVRVSQALLPLPPLPLPKGVKRPAPAASCPAAGITSKECRALDEHSAELSSKLLELEGKMKVLQGALGGSAAAAVTAASAKGAAAAPAKAAAPVAPAAAQVAPAASTAPAASASTSAPLKAGPAASGNLASARGAAASAPASAHAAAAAGASAASAGKPVMASASASAQGEREAHAAKATVGEGAASAAASAASGARASAAASAPASASASAAASTAAPAEAPTKQVRVLPKLKYKKEKPAEKPADYTLPIAAGVIGLLALAGAGFIYLRKQRAGSGPLKIWQGFRKKKAPEPVPEAAPPLHEVTPESLMQ